MQKKPKFSQHLHYKIHQIFGCEQQENHIEKEDIITQIQFDCTGQYLAVGDHAGRIIIFNQPESSKSTKSNMQQQFQYYSQFQSHLPEFDSLKSVTTSQSIKNIQWLRPQGKYNKMITSNANRIKLWKIFQKDEKKVILSGERDSLKEIAIPQLHKQKSFNASVQKNFPIKHSGAINNVEVTKNQQFLFSTDQNKALIWDLQKCQHPFVVHQISEQYKFQRRNTKQWIQGQNFSCSKFHPISDNSFICGSNKGRVQLSDLRSSFKSRDYISFENQNSAPQKINYFTQMTKSISSLDFMSEGKYIVARDYLGLKIWDVCKPNQPLKIIDNNQLLSQKLCHLFENDCMDDNFQMRSIGNSILSGSYDNRFNLIDPFTGENLQYKLSFNQKQQKDPINLNQQQSSFRNSFKCEKKILANGVHQPSRKIALASLNSFAVYYPSKKE